MKIIPQNAWYTESRYGGAILKQADRLMVQFDEGETLTAKEVIEKLIDEVLNLTPEERGFVLGTLNDTGDFEDENLQGA